VEPLGTNGETDPDQRDVEDDEDYHRQARDLEPLLSDHDQDKQEKQDDDHHRGDHGHPVGLPVQAPSKREQQLRH
jgi:hypothetical protein